MLTSFKIKNYRSIADEAVLSLTPALRQKEFPENILEEANTGALNVVAIYGANASGKTNLIRGLNTFLLMLKYSSHQSSVSDLDYQPFLLRKGYENQPTMMELTFTIDSRRYRYGIEYNSNEIVKEWLLKKDVGRESPLFERERDIIEPSSPLGSNKALIDAAIDATRPNALFLSMCDAFNIDEAKKVLSYINGITVINGTSLVPNRFGTFNIKLWQDENFKPLLQILIDKMGVDVKEIMIDKEESPADGGGRSFVRYDIKTKHSLYNESGEMTDDYVTFDMRENESSGTQQAFNLCGPVMRSLLLGSILFVDEIESKLHPVMTLGIIGLFLDKETNPLGAQLVFTTHDTNLLSYAHLRRDQICFMEKTAWESSDLFSLSDFVYYGEKDGELVSEKERVDTDKEKRYIEGRYGAIPVLGEFKQFVKSIWQGEEK